MEGNFNPIDKDSDSSSGETVAKLITLLKTFNFEKEGASGNSSNGLEQNSSNHSERLQHAATTR